MIGLDTNVLVRYIMQDDTRQSPIATRLIESLTAESPGFVSLVVIVELGWVLSVSYELNRNQLFNAFEALLRTKELAVENGENVWKAMRLFGRGSGDFADCLITCSAAAAGSDRTLTFDRGAARNAGMALIG